MRKKLLVFTVIFACILIAGCEGNKVSTNDQQESSPAVSEKVTEPAGDSAQQDKSEADSTAVYFTSDISAGGLVKIYEALEWTPEGNVAVKISTGEPPESNYRVQHSLRRITIEFCHAQAGRRGSWIYGNRGLRSYGRRG